MTNDLRPFQVAVPEEQLRDLRRRLADTRWPEPATVSDWSQGVPLHDLQALCGYWRAEYDWRATERRLNRWPQYLTDIDGLTIHYFHLPSPSPSAVPMILTHGWPGSFLEFEEVMEQLADSRTFGTTAASADFHLVVPSLPGYGFSGKPTSPGWSVHRIADAWAELMQRLGYTRFIAAGSDWGTSISTSLALHHPDRLLGLHLIPRWYRHCRLTEKHQPSRNGLQHASWTNEAKPDRATPQCMALGPKPSATHFSTHRLASAHGYSRSSGTGLIIPAISTRCSAKIKCWMTSRSTGSRPVAPPLPGSTGRASVRSLPGSPTAAATKSEYPPAARCFPVRCLGPPVEWPSDASPTSSTGVNRLVAGTSGPGNSLSCSSRKRMPYAEH